MSVRTLNSLSYINTTQYDSGCGYSTMNRNDVWLERDGSSWRSISHKQLHVQVHHWHIHIPVNEVFHCIKTPTGIVVLSWRLQQKGTSLKSSFVIMGTPEKNTSTLEHSNSVHRHVQNETDLCFETNTLWKVDKFNRHSCDTRERRKRCGQRRWWLKSKSFMHVNFIGRVDNVYSVEFFYTSNDRL